ncbi:DNA repair protein sms [Chlamydia pneumoniae TW-183]|uniref:DNA repair protein RadA n=3 Tax=Chlamydia pneumoniae TaxID=83558 RepID=RADA_CHLPN|nr:DNA repair protein RadA [Chlamydia pneumoniae]Q9Z9C8.1 RecName: Full=DNA repair protein RadA; AltName: Full=Branch migration protein RadA [Chlamydia pneumoniae]AAD18206.1 Sms Protein [Chlamydia pneumoniae CWL029]AAF38527.1 DNA repair protein [Chlamydia pneumoniae AR39]AAP97987.1 DNA repair protein sms [Chlamydia pneumoniae TW-183]ACZ33026.1 DNA repair protein RadA [Chlamydia pneumoniae LPCoLN]CRI32550.1 DNA repair protein RadA homolog [Chlamydia pneumoniae]
MATKTKTQWTCNQCGATAPKWLGQCPGCHNWNSLVEEYVPQARSGTSSRSSTSAIALSSIELENESRIFIDHAGWDRILGGGVVRGSLTLLGGDPGIGKSTLLLQTAERLASQKYKVLYVCGEESVTQTSLRAKRLNISSPLIYLFPETNLDNIKQQIATLEPDILIIDSIQIIFNPTLNSAPGSVAQVREVTYELMQIAKSAQITTFIIGHVTKSGEIAGPRVLEHLVDTVLYFEGNSHANYRMIRSVKNRFGPTNELLILSMHADGLKEVSNPSGLFLQEKTGPTTGSMIIPIIEGSGALLIELQALVSSSPFANPVRKTAGFDPNRFSLLLAVLEKRAQVKLFTMDVFLSITGGLKIIEPAADLGALLAVASSLYNRLLPNNSIVIGEVGLGGEIRHVAHLERRIKEGKLMGFEGAILPEGQISSLPKEIRENFRLQGVKTIKDAIRLLL